MRGIVSKDLVYNLVLNKGMSIQSNCIDIDNEFIIKLKRNVTTLYVYTSVLIQYYRNQQTTNGGRILVEKFHSVI